ncbi:MAG: hypothetical protein WDO70_05645 [Alphaproteobacteria bacterium]
MAADSFVPTAAPAAPSPKTAAPVVAESTKAPATIDAVKQTSAQQPEAKKPATIDDVKQQRGVSNDSNNAALFDGKGEYRDHKPKKNIDADQFLYDAEGNVVGKLEALTDDSGGKKARSSDDPYSKEAIAERAAKRQAEEAEAQKTYRLNQLEEQKKMAADMINSGKDDGTGQALLEGANKGLIDLGVTGIHLTHMR